MTSRLRVLLACTALSAWIVSLLTGFILAGFAHLLLVLVPILFPWRDVVGDSKGEPRDESST